MLNDSGVKCVNLAGAKSLYVWDGITKSFIVLMSPLHVGVQVFRKFNKTFFFLLFHMNQYFVRRKPGKSSELFIPPVWYLLESAVRDQLHDLQ